MRYFILILINFLKSKASMPSVWDPYNITILNQQSIWLNLWILCFFLFVFPLTSIQFPLSCHSRGNNIIVRVGYFSVTVFVSTVAALIFPQALFWFAYPLIIILFNPFTGWFFINSFNSFMLWWRATFHAVPPVSNTSNHATIGELRHEHGDHMIHILHLLQEEEDPSLEDGLVQNIPIGQV